MDEASWIEVSLSVAPEQAEAVAETLGRYTREGVVIEQLAAQQSQAEDGQLNPLVRVFGYFFADASADERKEKLERALWYLGRIQPLPAAQYRLIKDQDWMEAWKKQYQPVTIGERLVIVPAWIEMDFPGRIPIRINPGMAFGTGTHPTTQLCLALLEEEARPGMLVMDIGCGSGILSIAALRLGAQRALAVDIDPASVKSTRENCALNGLQEQVEVAQGSLSLLRDGHFGVLQAPLVVANILASVILGLLDDGLADVVEPGGCLLLAGLLDHQADEVIAKAVEQGLVFMESRQMDDWVALALVRPRLSS